MSGVRYTMDRFMRGPQEHEPYGHGPYESHEKTTR